MSEPKPVARTLHARAWLRIALLLLCVEKVIQHAAVTYAFASD